MVDGYNSNNELTCNRTKMFSVANQYLHEDHQEEDDEDEDEDEDEGEMSE